MQLLERERLELQASFLPALFIFGSQWDTAGIQNGVIFQALFLWSETDCCCGKTPALNPCLKIYFLIMCWETEYAQWSAGACGARGITCPGTGFTGGCNFRFSTRAGCACS